MKSQCCLEFILEDGYKIIVKKDENTNELITELYDKDMEFLEGNRIGSEDIYMRLIN